MMRRKRSNKLTLRTSHVDESLVDGATTDPGRFLSFLVLFFCFLIFEGKSLISLFSFVASWTGVCPES